LSFIQNSTLFRRNATTDELPKKMQIALQKDVISLFDFINGAI